jgi:bifunctional UDP-N-acetylglucosamine pyrophosphorylase/glucosamine-1-phosphate N-acetyltransferase
MSLNIVILAAGMGKRMKSRLPKVLHPLAGKPLLEHVVSTANTLHPERVLVVHGHGGDQVKHALSCCAVTWVEQTELLGTGDAVRRTLDHLPDEGPVLILYGDVPLITSETLTRLVIASEGNALGLLTAFLEDPHGYGRIMRAPGGRVSAIIEEKDATPQQRLINEINTGLMCVDAAHLKLWIRQLNNDNAQKEYYLTDIIAMAVSNEVMVNTVHPEAIPEILGVNDKRQLAELERVMQRRQADRLMCDGLMLADPERFDLRGSLTFGCDCQLDVNVLVEGDVTLGCGVKVGPQVVLRNCTIGDNVVVHPFSHIDGATIGHHAVIGPYARLRPGTNLDEHVHIGNFVETKKASIGAGSKANHLTYLGDCRIGRECNIGAGTITCNYDGVNKHETLIGDRVFVGSDTQLIAPVTVEDDATLAAGTTLRKKAPASSLTLTYVAQKSLPNWKRPIKKTTGNSADSASTASRHPREE